VKAPVIVVNSHVASGSVGGRASVFVLEHMGFPVCSLPTVQLAWHAGHGLSTRIAPPTAAFAALIGDIVGAPWLGTVGGLLTGYLAEAGQVQPIAQMIGALKERNPDALILCDPIIGDSNGLFRPADLAGAIRARLLPLADIATPNRFELAWLAGREPRDNRELIAAARGLGPAEVIVTSAFASEGEIGNLLVAGDGVMLASHRLAPHVPHGTGDLLAAVYLARRLDGAAPAVALEHAVSITRRLIDLAKLAGDDELPLAAARAAMDEMPAGVGMARIDP
jgi:pyridoxine kinase